MIVQQGASRGAGLERFSFDARRGAGRMVAIPGADDDAFGLLAKNCGGSAR